MKDKSFGLTMLIALIIFLLSLVAFGVLKEAKAEKDIIPIDFTEYNFKGKKFTSIEYKEKKTELLGKVEKNKTEPLTIDEAYEFLEVLNIEKSRRNGNLGEINGDVVESLVNNLK